MPEAHAKLGPSSADRWMACPGSVVLSEGMPSRTSDHAEEGTRAHDLAEAMLEGKAFKADPDMILNVNVYVEHVKELASKPGAMLHVETQVKITEDVWGTLDAAVWSPEERTLYVRDLKYGQGVPVEVSDNKQLKLYALGALLQWGYKAKVVNVGIVQPRLPHADGPIRSKDFNAVDLLEFQADVLEAVEKVHRAEYGRGEVSGWDHAYLHPTEKGCRWCLAAPICPKLKAKTLEVAKQAFTPAIPYDPSELAKALDYAPIVEAWVKNLREFAYAEAEKGNAIPGFKLVEKRANRKWRTEDESLEDALAPHILLDDLYEKKLKTPAQVEKLLDKEGKAALAELVVRESSGHTLVSESDPRPAVRVDAKAAFSE